MSFLKAFFVFYSLFLLTACESAADFQPANITYERSRDALEMPMRSVAYSDVGEYSCRYVDEDIHYNGNTTLQLVNCLMEAPAGSRTLVLTSSGGNVDFGIFAAQFVRSMRLDVEVVGWCASSCANYILPAARRVYLDQHSVVFVHGAPQPPDRDQLIGALASSGFTEGMPDFETVVHDNMQRSELTYRLHQNFKKMFHVGDYYYELGDVYSSEKLVARPGTSNLVFVDPQWLQACLTHVDVIAEAPNIPDLQKLFPRYNLVSFSQVRGHEYKCFP